MEFGNKSLYVICLLIVTYLVTKSLAMPPVIETDDSSPGIEALHADCGKVCRLNHNENKAKLEHLWAGCLRQSDIRAKVHDFGNRQVVTYEKHPGRARRVCPDEYVCICLIPAFETEEEIRAKDKF